MGGFTFKRAKRGAPPQKKSIFFVNFVSKYIIRNSQEISTELEYNKWVLRSLKVARGPKDPPQGLIGLRTKSTSLISNLKILETSSFINQLLYINYFRAHKKLTQERLYKFYYFDKLQFMFNKAV